MVNLPLTAGLLINGGSAMPAAASHTDFSLPWGLVCSQQCRWVLGGLKEVFGEVHSSRDVYFGSRSKKLGVIICLVN